MLSEIIAAAGPAVGKTVSVSGRSGSGGSVIIPLVIAAIVVYCIYRIFKRLRDERGGSAGDQGPGWNWPGWGGPRDWPKLPRGPKGSGPPPDYVPDEWVFEVLGSPPRTKTLEQLENERKRKVLTR